MRGPSLLNKVLRAASFASVPAEVLLRAETIAPELLGALSRKSPRPLTRLAVELGERLPLPPTVEPFEAGQFVRLPRHQRCFYLLAEPRPVGTQRPRRAAAAVLAIKGAEPWIPEFDRWVEELRFTYLDLTHTNQRRLAEHFALVEHKLPGALSRDEAEREFWAAVTVQRAHLARYGELGQFPVPLYVLAAPPAVATQVRSALSTHLSAKAFERIQPLLDRGLAVYVYAYPNLPWRVAHYADRLRGTRFSERLAAMEHHLRPEVVVQGWIQQLVRLMSLGFVPAAPWARGAGVCCDPNNAVIDGGFVDLDSVAPLAAFASPTALDEGLNLTFVNLCATLRTFLLGERREPSKDRDLPEYWIEGFAAEQLAEGLAREAQQGFAPDARIATFFQRCPEFSTLTARLDAYYTRRIAPRETPPASAPRGPRRRAT